MCLSVRISVKAQGSVGVVYFAGGDGAGGYQFAVHFDRKEK